MPAGPEKRPNRRHMLLPKTGDPIEYIPRLFDFSEVICPAERRALREIVETAEVVRQNGHVYLVARVSAATMDSLAGFETSREDLEDGGDHEQEEPESDLGYPQPLASKTASSTRPMTSTISGWANPSSSPVAR